MKITRRQSRISAIKILYAIEINNCNVLEAANMVFTEEIIDDLSIEFATAVLNDIQKIDELISKSLVNYTLQRLNVVDRAIIRLATKEMLDNVAAKIAINEALEITKIYSDLGDNTAVSFNNRLLDNIRKNLE